MNVPVPQRRSIQDRLAHLKEAANPLVQTDLNLLADDNTSTATFSVVETGELVVDEIAPLPVSVERVEPRGSLDAPTAAAYHLLLLPPAVTPEDVEALAVSVWSEAGWIAPGVLRLQDSVNLEGPWTLTRQTLAQLGVGEDLAEPSPREDDAQAWILRCPPRRGSAPSEQVQSFDIWARAFPEGMPVGVEQKVLDVIRRIARRLGGAIRVAGSGVIVRDEHDPTVSLRVFTNQWLPPDHMWQILSGHLEGLTFANQLSDVDSGIPQVEPGMPYALLAPVSAASQVLIGVRQERYAPRALRWENWARGVLFVHEIVWVQPEELSAEATRPTRRGRLERSRAEQMAETAAAAIATATAHAAVIDEDGFLLALDEPLPEEGLPHP